MAQSGSNIKVFTVMDTRNACNVKFFKTCLYTLTYMLKIVLNFQWHNFIY